MHDLVNVDSAKWYSTYPSSNLQIYYLNLAWIRCFVTLCISSTIIFNTKSNVDISVELKLGGTNDLLNLFIYVLTGPSFHRFKGRRLSLGNFLEAHSWVKWPPLNKQIYLLKLCNTMYTRRAWLMYDRHNPNFLPCESLAYKTISIWLKFVDQILFSGKYHWQQVWKMLTTRSLDEDET